METRRLYGFDLEGSQYFHLWWDTILLFNGEVAIVDTLGERQMKFQSTIGSFLAVPTTCADLISGTSVRRTEMASRLGGQTLARATVEYTFPIIEHIRGAIFYDIGYA